MTPRIEPHALTDTAFKKVLAKQVCKKILAGQDFSVTKFIAVCDPSPSVNQELTFSGAAQGKRLEKRKLDSEVDAHFLRSLLSNPGMRYDHKITPTVSNAEAEPGQSNESTGSTPLLEKNTLKPDRREIKLSEISSLSPLNLLALFEEYGIDVIGYNAAVLTVYNENGVAIRLSDKEERRLCEAYNNLYSELPCFTASGQSFLEEEEPDCMAVVDSADDNWVKIWDMTEEDGKCIWPGDERQTLMDVNPNGNDYMQIRRTEWQETVIDIFSNEGRQIFPGEAQGLTTLTETADSLIPISRRPSISLPGKRKAGNRSNGEESIDLTGMPGSSKRIKVHGKSAGIASFPRTLLPESTGTIREHSQIAPAMSDETERSNTGVTNSVSPLKEGTVESGNKKITWSKICSLSPPDLLALFQQQGAAKNGTDKVTPVIYGAKENIIEFSPLEVKELFYAHQRLHATMKPVLTVKENAFVKKAEVSYQDVATSRHEAWEDIKDRVARTASEGEMEILLKLHRSGRSNFLEKIRNWHNKVKGIIRKADARNSQRKELELAEQPEVLRQPELLASPSGVPSGPLLSKGAGSTIGIASATEAGAVKPGDSSRILSYIDSLSPLELQAWFERSGIAANGDNAVPFTICDNEGAAITLSAKDTQQLCIAYKNLYSALPRISAAEKSALIKAGASDGEVAGYELGAYDISTLPRDRQKILIKSQRRVQVAMNGRRSKWKRGVIAAFLQADMCRIGRRQELQQSCLKP